MTIVKLSSKYQMVLPKEAREAMKVDRGAQLLVFVRGGVTVIMPKPDRYARALAGIARGLYPRDYLASERRSW
ncbi:MAG: AbrB/MazE/SpoVT family DNA-binding domain-containing protein [Acidobacteriota bacterium]